MQQRMDEAKHRENELLGLKDDGDDGEDFVLSRISGDAEEGEGHLTAMSATMDDNDDDFVLCKRRKSTE